METLANPTCNASTLAPFEPSSQNPWNTKKIKHVYRRLSFGSSQDVVDAALSKSPGQFIDTVVNTAKNLNPTPAPYWAFYAPSDFSNYETQNYPLFVEWRLQTAKDLLKDDLRGRLSFFWMNHFVTRMGVYFHAPYAYQYYNLTQKFALGNFKEFTKKVGITPAMLIYLNGFDNTDYNPNENYARELFELFTMGEGNGYTQDDITEAARALTGYSSWDEYNGTIYFDSGDHDNGSKTIFGKTGNWGYDDLIDILFQERGDVIAKHIVTKLYEFFVSSAIDDLVVQQIIEPLAQTFINNNFELAPVLKQLFKSEHFFDERAEGVVVKSPIDVVFNLIKESDLQYNDSILNTMIYYCEVVGQDMYNPVDVAGWQRDESWINSSTLTGRWALVDEYIDYTFVQGDKSRFVLLAKNLSNDSNDPAFITKVLVDHFLPKALFTASDYAIATTIFKWEVPQNYYNQGIWSLNSDSAARQVGLLIKHIGRMPEFQLK